MTRMISQSGCIPPSVTLGRSETKTRGSRITNAYASESGRSMVEMLGVLAIIGVLSIGGIMGYSYGMDKYRANETLNDVNLRAIDLIAQASRGGDLSLAEWPTKTGTDYDIGLEIDTATNSTEGGIYVDKVPQRVCEIIADSIPDNVELTVNGVDYTDSCTETNKMVFYYGAIDEVLGETCNGPVVDGVCQPCEGDSVWNGTICGCASNTEFLSDGKCYPCPSGTTVSDSGKECNCPADYPNWMGLKGDGGLCKNEYAYLSHNVLCPDNLIFLSRCYGTGYFGCKSTDWCENQNGKLEGSICYLSDCVAPSD